MQCFQVMKEVVAEPTWVQSTIATRHNMFRYFVVDHMMYMGSHRYIACIRVGRSSNNVTRHTVTLPKTLGSSVGGNPKSILVKAVAT